MLHNIMQPTFAVLLLCLAAATSALKFPVPKTWLKTVDELDPVKYMGRWYQMYGNNYNIIFQGYTYCGMAQYKLFNSSAIAVHNFGYLKGVNGKVTDIRGSALLTEEPGQFRLFLDGVPFEGSYWVLKLGPVINNQYDYTVISSQNGGTLFVMTRDIARFKDYEQDILDYLKEQKFTDYLTRPVKSPQSPDCIYAPEEKFMPGFY